MRLVIIHDSLGNVMGLAASPLDGPVAYPETKPGQQTTLVDGPDMRGLTHQQIHERLTDVVANHKLDVQSSKARLVKR